MALRRPRSQHDYAQVLSQTLDDLKEVSVLAEDLITLARSDGGALTPVRQTVEVTPLLHKVVRKYERAAQSAERRLDLHVADGLTVEADPALLDRAVSNLIDNAIKYSGPKARITVTAEPLDRDWLAIRVSDDGPGLKRDEQARVLERFYRGEDGRRTTRGSGLGLAIVKAIATSLGGRVELVSTPGQGTTVTLVCRRQANPALAESHG